MCVQVTAWWRFLPVLSSCHSCGKTTDVVMAPILERQPESLDLKSLTEELPQFQRGQGDTPSPRTPSTHGSPSPPPIHLRAEPTALVPILAEDGIPYDHTLPQYLVSLDFQELSRLQNYRDKSLVSLLWRKSTIWRYAFWQKRPAYSKCQFTRRIWGN